MKHKFVIGVGLALLSTISLGAVAFSASFKKTVEEGYAATCAHEGFHYTERKETATVSGCREYWVCCLCHQHWLISQPGNFQDGGTATVIINDVMDSRFIASDQTAQDILTAMGFTFTTDTDGGIHITGYSDKGATSLIIPEGVVEIARVFSGSTKAQWVVLPETITAVASNAFNGTKMTLYFVTHAPSGWSGKNTYYEVQGTGWEYSSDGTPIPLKSPSKK